MREPTSTTREDLYQSKWWTRLAAFSEKRESHEGKAGQIGKARSGIGRTLASFFSQLSMKTGS